MNYDEFTALHGAPTWRYLVLPVIQGTLGSDLKPHANLVMHGQVMKALAKRRSDGELPDDCAGLISARRQIGFYDYTVFLNGLDPDRKNRFVILIEPDDLQYVEGVGVPGATYQQLVGYYRGTNALARLLGQELERMINYAKTFFLSLTDIGLPFSAIQIWFPDLLAGQKWDTVANLLRIAQNLTRGFDRETGGMWRIRISPLEDGDSLPGWMKMCFEDYQTPIYDPHGNLFLPIFKLGEQVVIRFPAQQNYPQFRKNQYRLTIAQALEREEFARRHCTCHLQGGLHVFMPGSDCPVSQI